MNIEDSSNHSAVKPSRCNFNIVGSQAVITKISAPIEPKSPKMTKQCELDELPTHGQPRGPTTGKAAVARLQVQGPFFTHGLARDQDRGWVRTHGCGLLGHAAGKALDPDVPHLATLRLLLARPTLAATAAVMARCLLLLRLRDSRRFCCTGDSSHLLLSIPQSHTTNRAGPSPKSKGVYGEVPSRGN